MNEFASQYEYAQRHGYEGTYGQYVQLQYLSYCIQMGRLDISPLSKEMWLANQQK